MLIIIYLEYTAHCIYHCIFCPLDSYLETIVWHLWKKAGLDRKCCSFHFREYFIACMFLIRKYTFTSALLHTQSLHLRHILKANHESTHISLVSIVSLNKSASTVSQFLPHRAEEHLPLLLPRVKCLPFFFPFYFLDE